MRETGFTDPCMSSPPSQTCSAPRPTTSSRRAPRTPTCACSRSTTVSCSPFRNCSLKLRPSTPRCAACTSASRRRRGSRRTSRATGGRSTRWASSATTPSSTSPRTSDTRRAVASLCIACSKSPLERHARAGRGSERHFDSSLARCSTLCSRDAQRDTIESENEEYARGKLQNRCATLVRRPASPRAPSARPGRAGRPRRRRPTTRRPRPS